MSSALFFKYNTQLGPPYQVLVDTNFINFSIKNKVGALVHTHMPLCPVADRTLCCGFWLAACRWIAQIST